MAVAASRRQGISAGGAPLAVSAVAQRRRPGISAAAGTSPTPTSRGQAAARISPAGMVAAAISPMRNSLRAAAVHTAAAAVHTAAVVLRMAAVEAAVTGAVAAAMAATISQTAT